MRRSSFAIRSLAPISTVALGIGLVAALPAAPANAAGIFVDGVTCTLSDALAAADTDAAVGGCAAGSGADDLVLAAGAFTGPFTVNSDVAIGGVDESQTILQGGDVGTVLTVASGAEVVVSNVTITDGLGVAGTEGEDAPDEDPPTAGEPGGAGGVGGIDNAGSLTLVDVTVTGNTGGQGGDGGDGAHQHIQGFGGFGGVGGAGGVGGINNRADLTLSRVTVSGNVGGAGGDAGATGNSNKENRVVSGRGGVAGGAGGTGGVLNAGTASVDEHSAITQNQGGAGGHGGNGGNGIGGSEYDPDEDRNIFLTTPGGGGGPGGAGGTGGLVVGAGLVTGSSAGISGNAAGTGGPGGIGGLGGCYFVIATQSFVCGPAGGPGATGASGSTDVAKGEQELTWVDEPPASAEMGSAFTVSAESSAQVPVAIEGTGDCSGSGNSPVEISADGPTSACTVEASQAGTGFYNAATSLSDQVTLEDTTLPEVTVTVTPSEVLQGAPISVDATATDDGTGVDESSESCDPVSSAVVGDFTAACTVADVAGNVGSGSADYAVLSAAQGIDNLIDEVQALNLPKKTQKSLVSKLNVAQDLRDAGFDTRAINKLRDFINQVKALSGKKISAADAAELIASAQALIASIRAAPSN